MSTEKHEQISKFNYDCCLYKLIFSWRIVLWSAGAVTSLRPPLPEVVGASRSEPLWSGALSAGSVPSARTAGLRTERCNETDGLEIAPFIVSEMFRQSDRSAVSV